VSNFWSKRLGMDPPPVPRQAPHQGQMPRGMGQNQDQTVAHYMDRRQFGAAPQWSQRPSEPDYSEGPPVDENGNVYYLDAVKAFKGTRKMREEDAQTGNCPDCGSNRYFSRRSEGKTTVNGFITPRPQCFDCGGMEQGALGISAKSVGASMPSRQGASPSMALAATMS
jgi:hypothetical protein